MLRLRGVRWRPAYALQGPVADYVTTETGTEGEVNEAVEQANFTNTKGGTVDAGVVLDSAPYLFTLTGAAGVGLLLTLRRRHQK